MHFAHNKYLKYLDLTTILDLENYFRRHIQETKQETTVLYVTCTLHPCPPPFHIILKQGVPVVPLNMYVECLTNKQYIDSKSLLRFDKDSNPNI